MLNYKDITAPTIVKWAAYLIVIYLSVYFFILAKPLLSPLLFAGFVAALLVPVANFLEVKLKFPTALSSICCTLLALVVIAGFFFFIYNRTYSFAQDLNVLQAQLNILLGRINSALLEYSADRQNPMTIPTTVNDAIRNIVQSNRSTLLNVLPMVGNSLLSILLFIVFTVLFLIHRGQIAIFLIHVLSGNQSKHKETIKEVRNVVRYYIVGVLTVSLILSTCNYIALQWVFSIEHALFFGVFAGILNVIPFIGPVVGSALPIIYTLATKDPSTAGFMGLYFIGIQQVESYFLTPNIVGSRVSINPLFTILGIFIGNMIWGVAGMIVFVPLLAMLKKIFDSNPQLRPFSYLLGDN